jgi:hypothetical protein
MKAKCDFIAADHLRADKIFLPVRDFSRKVLRQAVTDTFAHYRTSSRYRPLTGVDRD